MTGRITAGNTAIIGGLGLAGFAAPPWRAAAWAVAGVVSAGAVVVGVRRNAPGLRAPWWLLAAAIVALAAADVLFEVGRSAGGPAATLSGLCYLAMFSLVAVALVRLTNPGVVPRDRSRVIGLSMCAVAAALLSWRYVVHPGLDADHLGAAERSRLAAHVVGDLLILVAAVRTVLTARRGPAVLLLTAGAAGVLAADVSVALAQVGGWRSGGPAEAGYLLLYLCWGAAALHPSMVELTASVDARSSEPRARWIALLAVSAVVPPAVLLVDAASGRYPDGLMIAVAALLLCLLLLTHLTDTVNGYRRSVGRERGLREMCGALVAATEADEVRTAVRTAVHRLMPPGTPHGVLLAVDGSGTVAEHPPDADRRTRMTHPRALHPALREELGAFDDVLVCPLVPDRFRAGAHAVGSLVVAADGGVLAAARDAVEVLAAQATLALERIQLTEAMNRRDSERYLCAAVQNTSDVVLVVDDDERIRYASPSLAEVLGVDPPISGQLRDIVDPTDHSLLRHTLEWAGEPNSALDCWTLRRPDGGRVLVEVRSRDLRKDRMVRGFVITMRDVSERLKCVQAGDRRLPLDSPAGRNRRSAAKKFDTG